ncbi:MAG TPA: GTP cyclohydrolase FolE2 [Bdellovibrionales bacterium]|nr:GTP cyclohydrolase FolE2 [Bdellovibrionales bacterium]
MMETHSKSPNLADVALLPPEKNLELTLDEVGLENVQTQIRLEGLMLPANALATVSLVDKRSRGIHMSRMFRVLNSLYEHELTWNWLHQGLEEMLLTHQGLSDAAVLSVSFDFPVLRSGLVSGLPGWRNYPVTYRVARKNDQVTSTLETRVLYSSTCPCSASLSRQAIQAKFREDFPDGDFHREQVLEWLGQSTSMAALPHSQRSQALCQFVLNPKEPAPSTLSLIDTVEAALGTPVQAAVKREDEQEFARLNARHLMFCEDAARKIKAALLPRPELSDFAIEVRHFESLHPHDVVAKVRKHDAFS